MADGKVWDMAQDGFDEYVGQLRQDPTKREGVDAYVGSAVPSLLEMFQINFQSDSFKAVFDTVKGMDAEELARVELYVKGVHEYQEAAQQVQAEVINPPAQKFADELTKRIEAVMQGEENSISAGFYKGVEAAVIAEGRKIAEALQVEDADAMLTDYAGQVQMNMLMGGGIEQSLGNAALNAFYDKTITAWKDANPDHRVLVLEREMDANEEYIRQTLVKYFPPAPEPAGGAMTIEQLMAMLGGQGVDASGLMEGEGDSCGGCGSCDGCSDADEQPEAPPADDDYKSS